MAGAQEATCQEEPTSQETSLVKVPSAESIGAGQFFYIPVPMSNFAQAPPEITLIRRGNGARNGRLWIRSMREGLFVAGTVDGEMPDFPRATEQMLSKDHVEIWLAATPDLQLPEIGWGNQFGDETLPKGEESCKTFAEEKRAPGAPDPVEKCREWVRTQQGYRPYFKRLFVRQWLLAPDLAMESYATPAYDTIQKDFSGLGDKLPELMKPRGKPQMFLFPQQSGYSFEIFIPVEAFPPLPELSQKELYFLADVFKAAPVGKKMGAYSTSSPARVYGKASTFDLLQLDVPFYSSLTPCMLPLVGSDMRGEYHPAWFIPETGPGNQFESDTFVVVNEPAGYRYDPAGLSPTVRPTHYFWKDAGQGVSICGPHLTYRKADQSESFPYTISQDGFDTKRLPDGNLLIKTGPLVWYSEFGSGQCGACPRTDLRIFDLAPSFKLYPVLSLGDVMNPPALLSQDFTVSPDWSQITQFDLKESGLWSSTTWCLRPRSKIDQPSDYTYEQCGQKDDVQPPNPPVLKELRDLP